MKIRTLLIFTFFMCSTAGASAQGSRLLSVSAQNQPVRKILRQIEQQSDYLFFYDTDGIDKEKHISIEKNNNTIYEIMDDISDAAGFDYEIKGRHIILTSANPAAESPAANQSEEDKITGTVSNEDGEAIAGAAVTVKGATTAAITDENGSFSLVVPPDATIIVSRLGYHPLEIAVEGKSFINAVLKEDRKVLDEVVVVGYGTQRKGNLTGSVVSIKSEQLTIAPVSNVTHTLPGQLPGLVTKQSSGAPGFDEVSLLIRGFGNPLVIVDGVEGNINNIDASQIESISVLKDGSASIYGARAGNGVILVTTKRGVSGKPVITLNSSLTLQGVTRMIKPLSSGQYAQVLRENYINQHGTDVGAPFTEEEVQKYFDGSDPNYPNTDWFSFVFRKWAPLQNHRISIRGGGDRIKYYGFLGYTNQKTMVRENGGQFKRYNLQSNIDAKVTDRLSMFVDFSLIFEDRMFPYERMVNGSYLWACLYDTHARYPHTLPDPSYEAYGGNNMGSIAIASNMDKNGYNRSVSKTTNVSTSLTYDFKQVKGLKAKAFFFYRGYDEFVKIFRKQTDTYTYNYNTDEYTFAGSTNGETQLTEAYTRWRNITQQYSLSYDNVLGEAHGISGLLLFESIDYGSDYFQAIRDGFLTKTIDQLFAGSAETATNTGWGSEMGRASFVGRLNYSYRNKYLVETVLRADASAKFPRESRWGYFPSISLGWLISEESFMKNNLKALDYLKLRASYGASGNDDVGDFKYLSGYAIKGSAILGDQTISQIVSTGLANPNLTWEKIKIYNIGIDFSLLNRGLYGTLEGFKRQRSGIPASRYASLPSTFGAVLPVENLNSLSNRGFELTLGHAGKAGDLTYDISGNISWTRAKWDFYDEPAYEDPVQEFLHKQTGNWTDRLFGYKSDGLFTSQEEIDNLTFYYKDLGDNSTLRPGDIKYVDVNGDGVLDDADKVELGPGEIPHWMYGISGNFRYKNLDLALLFQGAFSYNFYLDFTRVNSAATYELRWTESSNDKNAALPRPGGAASNGWGSDYYIKGVSYLRLKSASLGYNLPQSLLKKIKISSARVYLAGTNLFTVSTLDKYGIDPEVPGELGGVYYYPQQRTISFGVNISF